jgi:CheY-like chemotaxis protein
LQVNVLADKKILLVEDEALVVEMIVDMLVDLGATVIGPAMTLADGLSLAETEQFDAAVLDVNLRGERIDPIAEVLAARAVPMVFATGYGAAGDYCKHGVVIDKPYTQQRLANAVLETLSMAHAVGADAAPPKR